MNSSSNFYIYFINQFLLWCWINIDCDNQFLSSAVSKYWCLNPIFIKYKWLKKRYLTNKHAINRISETLTRFGGGGAGGSCGPLSDGNGGWVWATVDVCASGEVALGRLTAGITWILDQVAVRLGQIRVDTASVYKQNPQYFY